MAIALQNVCEYYYTPGQEITGIVTTTPVVGKRFVKVIANRVAGPLLNTSAAGGNIAIAPATAAGAGLGVARWDGAVGALVAVVTGPGAVIPVTATGAIAAGVEVEIAANGTVSTYSSGIKVGYCVSGAADTADAQIKLY